MKTIIQKIKVALLIAILNGLSMPSANAKWGPVGTPDISPGQINCPYIAVDTTTGTPYVAFGDINNNSRVCVMKYDGTAWDTVGATGISAGTVSVLSLTVDKNGTPYVAYADQGVSDEVCVKKFDGTNWVTLDGNVSINSDFSYNVSITTDVNGTPYVAYNDHNYTYGFLGNRLNVQKFDGTNWVIVGSPDISLSDAGYISIAMNNNNNPWVIYSDGFNSNTATVAMFDGTNWSTNQNITPGAAYYTTIQFDHSGTPYIGYSDDNNNDIATVMTFNGFNWVPVGSGISIGYSAYNQLVFDNANNPWVVYMDWAVNYGTTVAKFDGTNWSTYGCSNITGGTAILGTLAFDRNNVPYVAVEDYMNNYEAAVVKYTQTSPSIQTQPTDQSVCPNINSTTFSVSSSDAVTYQWQQNDGTGFVNIGDGSVYSGTSTNTLYVNYPVQNNFNGYTYRCLVGGCQPDTNNISNAATFTANPFPTFTSNPVNLSLCGEEQQAQFNAPSADSGVTYQWEYLQNFTNIWFNFTNDSNTSGATDSLLTIISAPDSLSDLQITCWITSPFGCQSTISTQYHITPLDTVKIQTQPTDQNYCANSGGATVYNVVSSNANIYQWQENDGTGFVDMTEGFPTVGVTSSTLTIYYPDSYGKDGYHYRCVMEGSNSCVTGDTSTSALLTVVQPPSFSQNPSNFTACGTGTNAQFTGISSDSNATYQWTYYSNDSGWVTINNDSTYSGATLSTLSITGVQSYMDGNVYYVYATSQAGCSNDAAAQLSVGNVDTIDIDVQPVNTSVCGLSTDTYLSVSSSNASNYQWQENDGTGYVNMTEGWPRTGTNSTILNLYSPASNGMNGHAYRCILTGGQCDVPDTSNEAVVLATDYPAFSQFSSNVTACGVGSAAQFTAVPTDTTGITYQWQYYNSDSSSWIALSNNSTYSGVSGSTLIITGVTSDMNYNEYNCILTTSAGCTNNAQATLTVGNTPDTITIQSQPTDQINCGYTWNAQFNVSSSNAASYQWQQDDGSGFVNLNEGWPTYGTNTNSLFIYYPYDYGMNGYKYRCILSGSTACSMADTSNSVLFSVQGFFTQNASNEVVCGSDSVAQFSVAVSDTNAIYQWQLYDNNISNWINLSDSANYTGTATTTLNITGVNASMHGNQYNCLITYAATGCTNNSSAYLYVDSTPYIGVNATTTSVCLGSQVTLWGSNGDGSGFTWNNGVTDDVPFTPNASAMYTVTGNDNWGCPAIDSIMVDTVTNPLPTPVITAGGPTSFCSGGSVTLAATNTSASFNWSTGDVTSSINVSASANVMVTNTDNNGCFRNSVPVYVYTPVLPVATVNQQADCNGNSFSISAGGSYITPLDYDPAGDCSNGYYINGFAFAGVNNQGSGCSASAYATYSFYSSITAVVTPGTAYPFTFTPANTGINGYAYAIWIDLNNNGSFDDAGEMVYSSYTSPNDWSTMAFSDSLTIPANTASCMTRMRIRTSVNNDFSATDANREDNGETEDYMIQIGVATPFTYSWTSVPAGFTSNVLNPAIVPSYDTTYVLAVTDTTVGCTKTTSVTVDSTSVMPAAYGKNVWNVYAYNGENGINGNPQINLDTYEGYYVDTNLSFNSQNQWSNALVTDYSNYRGCFVTADNHSIQYKRQGFPAGYYSLDIPGHDDWVYVYINDSLVFEHDGCCDSHTNIWTGLLDSTSRINYTWIQFGGASYGELNFNLLFTTPLAATISGAPSFCKGAAGLTYSVAPVAGADYYVWTMPSGASITSGDSTNNIVVDFASLADSGVISVYGVNSFGAGTPSTFNVKVATPDSTIQASSATTFCAGSSVNLTGSANGSALEFSDAAQSYVDIPIYSPLTNYTYEISFKTSDPNATISSVKAGGQYGDDDRDLYLSNGDIYHYLWSSETINSSGQNYADNQWHHVAVVVDSGVGQQIYVDGIVVATGSKDRSDFYWNTDLYIGWENGYFNGDIDNVRLWNIVLTQNQIQQYMNSDVSGSPAGLIGNWKFDEGSGTTTVNSIDGTLATVNNALWIPKNSNTYTWSTGETTQAITVDTAGNYSVIITNSMGCSATSSGVAVTVNSLPTVTIDSLATVGSCHALITLTNGLPVGGTYSGTGVTSNQFDPSIGAGAYTITYTYTDTNGCSNADSTNINVAGATLVNAGVYSNVGICNTVVTLTNGTPSGGLYSGTSVSNNQFNPAIGAGSYTLTYSYTDTYGCSVSDSTSITVEAAPTVTMSSLSNVGICNSAFALTGGSPANGVYSGTGVSNGSFDPSVGAGTYTITYTYADNNGCTSSANTGITVQAAPTVTFSSLSNVGVCNTSVALAGGSPAGGVYSGTAVNSGIFNPSVAGPGNHTLTYTYQDTYGCKDSATSVITVTGIPVISSTTPGSRCDVGVVGLAATPSAGTVNWYANSTGGSSLGTGLSFTTPSISTSTTYYAEATYNSCQSSIRTGVLATVNYSSSYSSNANLCSGQELTVGQSTFNTTGTHIVILRTLAGCDSTVTLNLTVSEPITNTQTVSLCAGQQLTVGSNTYTTSGTYNDVLTAMNGCDSAVTTDLTVNPPIDVTTSVIGSTITANASSASYQWIDCNNGNSYISGQTGKSFTANSDGDYAVIVTENNCSSTSTCVDVIATGIETLNTDFGVSVYPNPNNGAFTIKASSEITYSILNELGQIIRSGALNNTNNYAIDVHDLSNGLYYLQGHNSHATAIQKIVVTK